MAKKAKELQDLLQEIEDLIAELAHLQDPRAEQHIPAEQNLSEGKDRIAQGSGPPPA
jgi:hypothetical protein